MPHSTQAPVVQKVDEIAIQRIIIHKMNLSICWVVICLMASVTSGVVTIRNVAIERIRAAQITKTSLEVLILNTKDSLRFQSGSFLFIVIN